MILDGFSSEWLTFHHGVPQGSLLGLLLFFIYTNDMPVVKDASMNMYADDTALYTIDNDPDERAAQIVTVELNAIHNWCYIII